MTVCNYTVPWYFHLYLADLTLTLQDSDQLGQCFMHDIDYFI